MRLFIAIGFNEIIRKEIELLQKKLSEQIPVENIKWVEPENIHLTIKFLGESSEEKIPEICKAIKKTASAFSGFEITLGTLGIFPNKKFPRVIWQECIDKNKNMINIKNDIEQSLEFLGYKSDRLNFSPHLTLGRLKNFKKKIDWIKTINVNFQICWIKTIQLVKSELTNAGPIYAVL